MRVLEPETAARPAAISALIVGSGFGGIGMAIAFQRAGMNDFLILEKARDIGGVWRDNTYPSAACDVPAHLYSFASEPNAGWSRMFASQAEIQAYLRRCVEKYQLRQRIRFGAEVETAAYDDRTSTWHVTLAAGQTLHTAMLITATGLLSRPSLPELPGIESFQGCVFHSARWDHGYALAGRRVAVVGTGASAIQFVPAIADTVRQLTMFQRSPPYLIRRPDRAYRAWENTLFRRVPWTMKLHRAVIYVRHESRALAFTRFKFLLKIAVGLPFQRMLKRQVPDAALRARLLPDYPIGCKRILLSNDYLATLARPNVALVTEGIRRVLPDGIESTDGRHHPVDAIIYATGFTATKFLSPMRISGRGGLALGEVWQGGATAYLGLTVPGFPNLFMLYGPNTNLGHNSVVYMLESQIAHVMRCRYAMKKKQATTVEVKARHHDRFNRRLQRRLTHSVWNGCKSWYLDASGRNSTSWPGFTLSYRWLTRFSSLQAYMFEQPAPDDDPLQPPAFEMANKR